ncbi:MAG: sodium:proton antiporter [Bacteroidetes bacterium HGW-Bacteroidetes-4]|jgi:Na+/H+ antiporter NhaC|nr:MAG: sodium:proton antiporter [Bacteroidetes bacterium HGW-Bacteroidetes-4]
MVFCPHVSLKKLGIILAVSLFLTVNLFGQNHRVSVNMPDILVKGIEVELVFETEPGDSILFLDVSLDNKVHRIDLLNGRGSLKYKFTKKCEIQIPEHQLTIPVNPIPLWLSILPPLIAILMALMFREVITSLITGILVGTSIIFTYQTGSVFLGIPKGFLAIIDTYIIDSLRDPGHIAIIVFSMMIGGMVAIITRNGGMQGVVNKLTKYAINARSGQLVTWLLGIAIFFDDYANTLVVGNTMRPVTDRLKISRQKLAYIVDSTAAPVAAIAFVTTWIGAELSYIQSGISHIGLNLSPYEVFFNSLNYSFYPVFTLVFIFFLIHRGVDYGPMYHAEIKARHAISTEHESGINESESSFTKPRWYNAAIPVFVVIAGTITGLLYTGWDAQLVANSDVSWATKLSAIIGNSDSYKALLWSSLLAAGVAIVLTVGQKLLSLSETIDSLIDGFRTMLTAIVILVLAWSIALVTEHMHTANFISNLIVETSLSPVFVPLITFVLAALVAFSTGSSWGTMAILYPLLLPATWLITQEFSYTHDNSLAIFYNVVANVLAGSVLGDHCSPISDTTILSSLASQCPHIEHVRTQMPYALTVGAVAAFIGVLPGAMGVPSWITFPVGIMVLFFLVKLMGKKTDAA